MAKEIVQAEREQLRLAKFVTQSLDEKAAAALVQQKSQAVRQWATLVLWLEVWLLLLAGCWLACALKLS